MIVCTSTMRYNLLNILAVMILVVGSEQLQGRLEIQLSSENHNVDVVINSNHLSSLSLFLY